MADFKVESLTIEVRMDTGDFLAGVERVLTGLATVTEAMSGFARGLAEGLGEAEDEMADAGEAASAETTGLVDAVRELNENLAALNARAGQPFDRVADGADRARRKTAETASEVEKLGKSLGARIKSVVTGFAAPMLASLALGGLAKNWLATVGEAAEKTGAVNVKLEEERRKREALARVTREDIELYRKGREALARFQMMMDRLSATVMRAFGPALGWLVERFNAITDWVGRNEHNITRFFKALALTMTTLLIPATIKWGAAWLANPITWIIGALMLLALVIDDLMTYMEGGESLFNWGPFLETVKPLVEWLKKAAQAVKDFIANNPQLVAFLAKFLGLYTAFKGGWLAIGPAVTKTASIFGSVFSFIFSGGGRLLSFIVRMGGIFKNSFGIMRLAVGGLGGALRVLGGILRANPLGLLITAALLIYEYWEPIKKFFADLWGWIEEHFPNFAAWARDAAAAIFKFFSAPLEWIREKLKALTSLLPDWVKKKLGFADAPEGGEGAFAAPPGAEPGAYGVALGEEFDRMQASLNETYAPVTNNNQRTVTIGDVTVNTAATDPAAAAREIMKVGNLFGGTAAAEGGIR